MKILEAAENYLETILVEQTRLKDVRSIDICAAMGYSKPTISVMMKKLRENGYIDMSPEGYITLTESGRAIAERVYERHQVISSVLMALGVSRETAGADACKIEHDISEETFECIKRYYERISEEQ